MATVIGELREGKATWGENVVFRLLQKNLPKDFTVYAECPVAEERQDVHPDFIVLTNYGYIVLEVKDWKVFQKIDAYHAYIFTGKEATKRFPNPVETTRNYAISLKNKFKLHKQKYDDRINDNIPFGYAVVFPHAGTALKTQLQRAWGENYVFNQLDLNPGYINKRIRETIPTKNIKPLTKEQMDMVRSVINPEIVIENISLDEEQEKVVMEVISMPPKQPVQKPTKRIIDSYRQEYGLFSELDRKIDEKIPEENFKIANSSARLVRGSMGSGKTLVLQARARRLAHLNPDWKILVMTFNQELAYKIKQELSGVSNIKTTHIHEFIKSILTKENGYEWREVINQERWVRNQKNNFPIIQELGVDFVADEIKWIQEVMLYTREQYLKVNRVGRGSTRQLMTPQREKIYDVLEALNIFCTAQRQFTWETLVVHFLEKLKSKEILTPQFDAILIDEAQDFAPSWIAIVNYLLKDGGTLFLTDDPAQSIFRYFTWRQKGVNVVGRTRWLKIPYRSTRQIYEAANAIIKDDEITRNRLKAEGDYEEPDYTSEFLREGKKPLLSKYSNLEIEIQSIESQIVHLRQRYGVPYEKIAITHNNPYELNKYKKSLSKYGVKFLSCGAIKGLDFDAVFLCGLDTFFNNQLEDQGAVSHEKGVVYMTMGRARTHLFLNYRGGLAEQFDVLENYVEHLR